MPALVVLGKHTERALFVGIQTSREAAERGSGSFKKPTRFSVPTEKEEARIEEVVGMRERDELSKTAE